MALTVSERVEIAESGGVFSRKVKGALVKHAKYILRNPESTYDFRSLASLVVNDPEAYVVRFAIAILTEPIHDDKASDAEITDGEVQAAVAELWPVFSPILSEPPQ